MGNILRISLFLFLLSWLPAQNIRLSGNIFASESQEKIVGAEVFVKHTNIGAISNEQGEFTLELPAKGNYELVIRHSGYKTLSRTLFITSDTSVVFSMEEFLADLPSVTIIAGNYDKINEVAGSFYYLPLKELSAQTYIDPTRVLQNLPGVNVQEEDGFGLRPNIGLRGTSMERSTKITIMEDGVPVAPAPYTAPASYYFPFILRMHSLEITKGAYQLKYGPNTIGGVINFISTPVPEELSGRFSLLAGSWNTKTLHAYIGNTYKKFGFLLETAQLKSDGFQELIIDKRKFPTGPQKQNYLAKFSYKISDKQNIILKISQEEETSYTSYTGLTKNDFKINPLLRYPSTQEDVIKTRQRQLHLFHTLKPLSNLEISTAIYGNQFQRAWYKLNSVYDAPSGKFVNVTSVFEDTIKYSDALQIVKGLADADSSLKVRNNNRNYYAYGVKSVAKWKIKSKKFLHEADFGINYHIDGIDRYEWEDLYGMENNFLQLNQAGAPGSVSNRTEQTASLNAFLEWEIQWKKLSITPLIRWENINTLRTDYGKADPERTGSSVVETRKNFNVFLPGAGVNYQWKENVSFFGSVYKGFTSPGTKVGTEYEESINYELGTKFKKNRTLGEVVFFYSDYQNLLGSDLDAVGGTGSLDLFNAGEALAWGIEYFLRTAWLIDEDWSLPFSLSYTYTEAYFKNAFQSSTKMWKNVEKGDQMPYIPRHQITATVGLNYKHGYFSLRSRWQSDMWSRPGKGELTEYVIPAYFLLDLTYKHRLNKYVLLTFQVNNLTDNRYLISDLPAGVRPGRPRMFQTGAEISF